MIPPNANYLIILLIIGLEEVQYSTFQHKNVESGKFSTFMGAFSVENHVENVENSWFYRYLQAVENFILQRKSTIQAKIY